MDTDTKILLSLLCVYVSGVMLGFALRPDQFTANDAKEAVKLIQANGLRIVDVDGNEIESVDFAETN